MNGFEERLGEVLSRIDSACRRAGRTPQEVSLMAVSKMQPDSSIAEAARHGLRLFGESRVQETASRIDRFPEGAAIHLIGHLQRNKAAQAARIYTAVDSIDAARTAHALDRACLDADRREPLPVLIEVNTSGEEQKFGVKGYDDAARLIEAIAALPRLRVYGLMTIGPYSRDEATLRTAFAGLRTLRDTLSAAYPQADLSTLSMGMSGDMESAILEGSTVVRVGTALFGARA